MSYPRTPVSTTLLLSCPFCGADQEVNVSATIQLDVRPDGRGWLVEDVQAEPLADQCWHCRAPRLRADLAAPLAAKLDALTAEDFR